MIKKISLRLRIAAMTCTLLAICCISLAIFINISGTNQMNQVAVIVRTSKTSELVLSNESVDTTLTSADKELLRPAHHIFNVRTIVYCILIVVIGGIIAYLFSARIQVMSNFYFKNQRRK